MKPDMTPVPIASMTAKPASRALTFVYVGDVEAVMTFLDHKRLLDGIPQADRDAIERLRFRAQRTRASIEGSATPAIPDAEKRMPT